MRLTTVGSPKLSYKPLDTLLGMPNITPRDVQDKVIEVRTSKLPDYKLYPNVGSFFKNPTVSSGTKDSLLKIYQDMPTILVNEGYKIPAAWLIEHIAHAKGVTVRSVGTWPSQPLVIVNYGNSNAEEILSFSQELVKKIEERTGVTLEREVNYIG
jgi:UDP-N-acetylmuramate dehydrogenase